MQYRLKLITELLASGLCLYSCLRYGTRKDKALYCLAVWITWNIITEMAAAVSAYIFRNNLIVYSISAPVRFVLIAGYFHYCHPAIRKHRIALFAIAILTAWYFITLLAEYDTGQPNTLFLQAECIAVWLLSIIYLYLSICSENELNERIKRSIATSLLLSYSASFACRTFIGIGTELHYPVALIHHLYLLTYIFGILPYPWIALTLLSMPRPTKNFFHV